ncbi:4-hydroxy-tetrahydrodipicolinate reductase [Buchnera aphidicola]|uniref:4-hydroxy-tetrahydrodipicolinate reductase n=1 Tax=Buchnera aphidicola str. Ua (Uroleucon ambrosiae) TaxID=1005057 RepID=G2LP22_BUCUM|nr:4-hydroxy-tetrahydrodipicolinate reductase [Buchnera aphidicola]AEO07959.1 dihydrodipicolinate reductase [Buchnera aphidicola str. Ua (Uroleucon ambrosiae)]
MNKKIRIAISGPLGRMGQTLIKEIIKNQKTSLTTVFIQKNHQLIGKDVGKILGIGNIGIFITDKLNIQNNNFDVLIDFTTPNSTLKYLKYCNKFNKNIIIGTTGFSEDEIKKIKIYSQNIAIIMSSNFSIGMNIMFNLIKKTTQIIGKNSDIDIIEYHHRNKIDAPSGTALKLGEIISKEMKWDLNNHSLYYKKGITNIREHSKIGFSIIRSGNIVGKHTVMFSSSGEEIKITHTASSRVSFAQGAIHSALWIQNKKQGLFDMSHVLSF